MNDVCKHLNPDDLRVVLVLQGGGALGAYHGGACQALYEHDLAPDWIAGVSIGALNGAILAGNEAAERIARLREFWSCLSQPGFSPLGQQHETLLHQSGMMAALRTLTLGVPGMFRPRLDPRFLLGWPVAPHAAGVYDTSPLETTLQRLVDVDVLNSPASPRYSASAITVRHGTMVTFDSWREPVDLRHVRASAAVPPGFPPVCIDGEWYWDAALYSNTPLQAVFDEPCERGSLVFLLDLWSEDSALPATFDAAMTHRKDAFYATRSRRQLDDYERIACMRHLLWQCRDHVPPALRMALDEAGGASDQAMHVVRLRHAVSRSYTPAKDLDFTAGTVQWRWQRGYADMCMALQSAPWRQAPPSGTPLVVHEIPACLYGSQPDSSQYERNRHVFPA